LGKKKRNMICSVCSGTSFIQKDVLKERLIKEWQLNNTEVNYINRQQGYLCTGCNSSLRAITLADCILKHYGYKSNFNHFVRSKFSRNIKVLEINAASRLHEFLKQFKQHTFAEYPMVDMQKMNYNDNCFDMIVHSDTLEHVQNSLIALRECYRVLKPNGVLFYTIPIIKGRLTKSRDRLPNSFHGNQEESQGLDYKVFKECGADFWVELINAGFKDIGINSFENENTIAIYAIKKDRSNDYSMKHFPLQFRVKEFIKKIIKR